jgi:predicted RNA binding protein YcfA (HicA-like mRNA interferase family)
MPRRGPIKRADLVRYLRRLGFDGPHPGGKHQYMKRGTITVRVPNPHRDDIGVNLLVRVLAEAGVSKQEWEAL